MKINLILVSLLLVCIVELAVGRGRGGGGSSGGGSRGGGGRSSGGRSYGGRSRSSGGSRSKGGKSASGYKGGVARYSGLKKAVAAGVIVRGRTRYRSRFSDYDDYDEDPPICYSDGTEIVTVGNVSTSVMIGYFVCPYKPTDTLKDRYCCGPATRQTCCKFWEDGGRTAGAVIGIIFGVIFLFSFIFIIIKCCCRS